MYDSIAFKIVLIPLIQYISIQHLSINTQIPYTEILENETESSHV